MNVAQQAKVFEARAVLARLGFPTQQSNERSALCRLCLLDLRPGGSWAQADGSILWRTHELMQWLRDHYDQDYAANTRETIRRQTLHQFIEAGLILYNPDHPNRAVNSPANCYQIGPAAVKLLRRHDEKDFDSRLAAYRGSMPGLAARYAASRGMAQIPVTLGDGTPITLTAGGQNVLIKAMSRSSAVAGHRPDASCTSATQASRIRCSTKRASRPWASSSTSMGSSPISWSIWPIATGSY